MDKIEIIKQIEKRFCPLTDDNIKEWSERGKLLQLKKGHILAYEGKRCNKLWFVVEGVARASYIKDGKKICDWFTLGNDFICALSSFYAEVPSIHQVDLLSDATLLETSKEDMMIMCEKYHEMERVGRISASETMIRLQEKIVSIQFETAQQKLHNLLQKHPDIYQHIPLGDIASYIGITQETLSRLRANYTRI